MQPILTFDIQQELENVKTVDDFKKLLRKYPTRLSVSLKFNIDGETYQPSGDWSIDLFTGVLEIERR